MRQECLCRKVFNGQGQGYGHFDCEYLASSDRYDKYWYWPTNRKTHFCFRLEYLHLILVNSNGQPQSDSHLDFEIKWLYIGSTSVLLSNIKSNMGFRLAYFNSILVYSQRPPHRWNGVLQNILALLDSNYDTANYEYVFSMYKLIRQISFVRFSYRRHPRFSLCVCVCVCVYVCVCLCYQFA